MFPGYAFMHDMQVVQFDDEWTGPPAACRNSFARAQCYRR
jgi:hypothetical protein